ncbi:hypothetical protein E5676_scaffold675G00900 [Cucumis melo var. makuwa]|uniref:Retrovirus-related Pol polyprotein from transposon TNT 1-94-like beta-barrel domain-containing protein n=1 Tax=Cucumis melo var. makuwa TaxID=1194695 RepID=A0A5D3BZ51_CUCMM|nr:hypothetical protein E6C27_scaffold2606G00410 [Cucumis melo var. makuwa]TYK04400.1 hypothetical protein E5676_scaffold675G00900 [Cucumis melo var. makuwa]
MITFIKSIDSKCWKAVITSWEHPFIKDHAGKEKLKPGITWSKEEDEASLGNSRALNAIFNAILGPKATYAKKKSSTTSKWVCHFYNQPGHIRLYYYKLHGIDKVGNRKYRLQNASSSTFVKHVWKVKESGKPFACNVAFTSIYTTNFEYWYFDNGCPRHVIRNSLFFTDLKESKTGQVTFGDGVQGKVIGKGYFDRSGTPNLHDVILVEGLSTNLISISQLCDQGFRI